MAKSTYGFGASWYNFTRAWADDDSYDIPESHTTLARASAAQLSCTNDICTGAADIADLSLDLAAGKIPVNSRFLPFGIEAAKTPRVPVSSMFSPMQNRALDFLQGFSAGGSILDSRENIQNYE